MSFPPKVFICRRIPQTGIDLVRKVAEVTLHKGDLPPSREELLNGVRDCTGILSLLSDRIDAEVMDAAGHQLRVISNFAVGVNNIDLIEAKRRGISVGNTPDVLTDATADIAVALLLAAARKFKSAMQAAQSGGWRTWEPLGWLGQGLNNKTLGIVGMGRIGLAVARRLHYAWGMKVVYTARASKQELCAGLAASHVSLEELVSESDFVSVHVPLTEATRNIISYREFNLMKPSTVFVNTSRGEVVDQDALIQALEQNKIFAAGLDVCTPEPLPLDNPLLQLPNCILLPHIGSATYQTRDSMAERAASNLVAGINGLPLPYPVSSLC